jgi:hypothetical protein
MIFSSEYNVNAYPELYSIISMPVALQDFIIGHEYIAIKNVSAFWGHGTYHQGELTSIIPRSEQYPDGPYAVFDGFMYLRAEFYTFYEVDDPDIPTPAPNAQPPINFGEDDDMLEEERYGGHVEQINLDISKAPKLGEITVNLGGEVNAISQEEFKDGDECVRIPTSGGGIQMNGRGYSIFKVSTLQDWFKTGSHKNPLTNEEIQQEDLEMFLYKAPAGGRRKARTKAKARKTKTKKAKAKAKARTKARKTKAKARS